jgi:hypothetical protein
MKKRIRSTYENSRKNLLEKVKIIHLIYPKQHLVTKNISTIIIKTAFIYQI